MKVLFLTPQIPYPPLKGTAARNFNILRYVAGKHDVHLLTFEQENARDAVEALKQVCAGVHLVPAYRRSMSARIKAMATSAAPDLALRLASSEMTLELSKLAREVEFDIVQIEGLEMAVHWERTRVAGGFPGAKRPLIVFDDHNCEYLLQKRAFEIDRTNPSKWTASAYSLLQWRRLMRFEAMVASAANGVIVVSEEDLNALGEITTLPLTTVIQNGIDTASFASGVEHFQLTSGAPHLVFTGTMDYRPNVDAVKWFCKNVFGRIRSEVPNAKLWIVGSNPKEEVKRLSKMDGVIVTGFVEDVRQFLDRATVYVVPMRFGGGTRFKVLEAMASGLPLVSTTLGCQGIRVTDGIDALIEDNPERFAAAVLRLLSDTDLRRTLASNAVKLARHYDWSVILPKVDEFYDRLSKLPLREDVGVVGGNR